jgi:hypothetical protein
MTPFCFEHVFRVGSVAEVFAAYFDADHQREQDRAVAIVARETLESIDDGVVLRRVSRVVPARQLPSVIRPFIAGGQLSYLDTLAWRRRDDVIDIAIQPSLLGGRARIDARYQLTRQGPTSVFRRYAGEVRVELPLIAARIERGIIAELATSLPIAASVTQAWLDQQIRSVTVQA